MFVDVNLCQLGRGGWLLLIKVMNIKFNTGRRLADICVLFMKFPLAKCSGFSCWAIQV